MNELLLTLAEEIRQAMVWLCQEKRPQTSNIRFRLHTLREAASIARMNSVDQVLADLEEKLNNPDIDNEHESTPLQDVLERLADLLVTLAHPIERQELAWAAQFGKVAQNLDYVARQLHEATERLTQFSAMSDQAILSSSQQAKDKLVLQLGRNLRQEVNHLKDWRYQLSESTEKLQLATRALIKEISATHQVPMETLFARLRDRVRRWGRSVGKPLSLECRGERLQVGIRQFEPIAHILDCLLEHNIQNGLDDPEQRRQADKPTVANITLAGHQNGALLTLVLEDDGLRQRAYPVIENPILLDLIQLRARICHDTTFQTGYRLILQLPIWYSSLEALPISTQMGNVLIPLPVVEQIVGEHQSDKQDLPVIELDRRVAGTQSHQAGLICSVGSWRGWLPSRVTGPVMRVVARRANDSDPAWVVGRVIDEWDSPLIHPLPFCEMEPNYISVYPEAL